MSKIFDLAKVPLRLFESHLYLTSDIFKYIRDIQYLTCVWRCWTIRKITERRTLSYKPPPLVCDTPKIWASYQMRKNCGLHMPMRRKCRERFPRHRLHSKPLLAIPACITARAWRTCRDACRDPLSPGGGENVPDIPGARTARNFVYLVRGPCQTKQSCTWFPWFSMKIPSVPSGKFRNQIG